MKTKVSKTTTKAMLAVFVAIAFAGTAMAVSMIWSETSTVNVILKGNVLADPSLNDSLDIVQGCSYHYNIAVNNPDDQAHNYTLIVTSNNPGITITIGTPESRNLNPGASTSYDVEIHASTTATGSATLTWAITQT